MRLSVYQADMQTPRGVLQLCIDEWKRQLESTDDTSRQRARRNLNQFGGTVEMLVQHGWRVFRLPISAFLDRGYILDGPEPDGHRNVEGDDDLYSVELASMAEVLSAEECLA